MVLDIIGVGLRRDHSNDFTRQRESKIGVFPCGFRGQDGCLVWQGSLDLLAGWEGVIRPVGERSFTGETGGMGQQVAYRNGGASGKWFWIVKQDRCLVIGSSSRSLPASRSCKMAVLVNNFVIEPIR